MSRESNRSVRFMKTWLRDMYKENKKVFNCGMSYHASQDTPSAKGAAVEKYMKFELEDFGLITSKPEDTAAADYQVNGYDYQFKGYTVQENKTPSDTKVQCSTMVLKDKANKGKGRKKGVDFSDVMNAEFFTKESGKVDGKKVGKFLKEKYNRPADVLQMIDQNTKLGCIYVFEFENLFSHVVSYKRDETDKRIYHLYDKDGKEIISTGPNTTNANCWYRGVWMNYQFIMDNVKPVIKDVSYKVFDDYQMFKKSFFIGS